MDFTVIILYPSTVAAFLSDYGWYLLFLGVGIYLLIQHLSKKRSGGNESRSASAVNQGQNKECLVSKNVKNALQIFQIRICTVRVHPQTPHLW